MRGLRAFPDRAVLDLPGVDGAERRQWLVALAPRAIRTAPATKSAGHSSGSSDFVGNAQSSSIPGRTSPRTTDRSCRSCSGPGDSNASGRSRPAADQARSRTQRPRARSARTSVEQTGVSRVTVGSIERGEHPASVLAHRKLAGSLAVDIGELPGD